MLSQLTLVKVVSKSIIISSVLASFKAQYVVEGNAFGFRYTEEVENERAGNVSRHFILKV